MDVIVHLAAEDCLRMQDVAARHSAWAGHDRAERWGFRGLRALSAAPFAIGLATFAFKGSDGATVGLILGTAWWFLLEYPIWEGRRKERRQQAIEEHGAMVRTGMDRYEFHSDVDGFSMAGRAGTATYRWSDVEDVVATADGIYLMVGRGLVCLPLSSFANGEAMQQAYRDLQGKQSATRVSP